MEADEIDETGALPMVDDIDQRGGKKEELFRVEWGEAISNDPL